MIKYRRDLDDYRTYSRCKNVRFDRVGIHYHQGKAPKHKRHFELFVHIQMQIPEEWIMNMLPVERTQTYPQYPTTSQTTQFSLNRLQRTV
jgi:hypothetical protein